jgi:hypothetical protein
MTTPCNWPSKVLVLFARTIGIMSLKMSLNLSSYDVIVYSNIKLKAFNVHRFWRFFNNLMMMFMI